MHCENLPGDTSDLPVRLPPLVISVRVSSLCLRQRHLSCGQALNSNVSQYDRGKGSYLLSFQWPGAAFNNSRLVACPKSGTSFIKRQTAGVHEIAIGRQGCSRKGRHPRHSSFTPPGNLAPDFCYDLTTYIPHMQTLPACRTFRISLTT